MKTNNKYLKYYQTKESVLLTLSAASLIMAAYRMYKEYFSKHARKCSTTVGIGKSLCMTDVEIKALKRMISSLKNNISKCNQIKDETKKKQCIEKINKKIVKTKERLMRKEKQFRMLQKAVRTSKT